MMWIIATTTTKKNNMLYFFSCFPLKQLECVLSATTTTTTTTTMFIIKKERSAKFITFSPVATHTPAFLAFIADYNASKQVTVPEPTNHCTPKVPSKCCNDNSNSNNKSNKENNARNIIKTNSPARYPYKFVLFETKRYKGQ